MTTMSISKATLMFIISILTIIGNSLVVIVGWKNWSHTRSHMTHLLVFSLAIADLTETFIAFPIEFTIELLGEWIFSDFGCRFVEYCQALSFGVAVFIITFIAIDRYLSVVRPLTGRIRTRHGKWILVFCWSAPMLILFPYVFLFKVIKTTHHESNETIFMCQPVGSGYDWLDRLYWTVELYYTFLLPMIIMIFCYTSLVRKVLRMKKVGQAQPSVNSLHERVGTLSHMKRKSVRLALSFVTLFVVCWGPRFVMDCYRIAYGTRAVTRTSAIYEVALFMAYTNQMLNPVLYALIDTYFKQKLKNLFRRQITTFENSTETNNHTNNTAG
ncbi:predicted protein [Nematostella vectensis]|uniref:G-protein coupled receptors family 1 profile domain-containing protein n=2 Tax=Nematostella vectensis TaxID=45351 RepID=A7RTH4_NEMVE|nr:predicted protein [Nematostella vectensis]|eukprot:XP_001637278.1 predicted protein [Nematostella vectensis]